MEEGKKCRMMRIRSEVLIASLFILLLLLSFEAREARMVGVRKKKTMHRHKPTCRGASSAEES
jgi:hypothetical protein